MPQPTMPDVITESKFLELKPTQVYPVLPIMANNLSMSLGLSNQNL